LPDARFKPVPIDPASEKKPMSKRAWLGLILVIISLLPRVLPSGGPQAAPPAPPPPERDPNPDVALYEETSLAALLDRPRSELAALAEQWSERVALQRSLYQQGKLPFHLLPDARLPVVVPVWRQARLSPKAGFSLPPYHLDGTRDTGLALHLARYGDIEAARLLADPADQTDLTRIDALRLGRNYPVEWTRIVGMVFQHAEVSLAQGNDGAAGALANLHQQLVQILDAKAQRSPLGGALLGRGRAILGQAAAAWRRHGSDALAQQAEAVLAEWGEVPPLRPGLAPGDTRAEVARLLGATGKGRALTAGVPQRALDVLGLPFSDDNAETAVAFLDAADHLSEVLIVYRAGLTEEYRQPAQLAQRLEDQGHGEDQPGDLPRRRYRAGDVPCEVVIVPRNPWAGAFVRLGKESASTSRTALPRDLGLAHLNRSFEENRLRCAPSQYGDQLRVSDAKILARLRLPLAGAQLAEAVLTREPQKDNDEALAADVVRSVTMRLVVPERRPTLSQVAEPVWQAAGAARATAGGEKESLYLALTWEDSQTRYVLRLPNGIEDAPELEIGERPGKQSVAERAARARAWDQEERLARLQQDRPLTRLPRELDRLQLGLQRDELLALMPAGENVVKRDLPSGVLVTVLGAATGGGPLARELFVRFDAQGRAAALHVRYTDTPGNNGGTRKLLESFRARAGSPRESVTVADSDLPGKRKPITTRYQWHDDLTALTCLQKGAGLEVILRDRPAADDADVTQPTSYLPRGPEGCTVGTSREDLLRTWHVRGPAPAGQALVLTLRRSSPYDALWVWLENDRVVAVRARHKQENTEALQAAQAGQAVTQAWAQDAAALGWPRQQDLTADGVVQGWTNHDDRTLVRIFWQVRPGEAPRVFTEWRERATR
jgi:hypothetical protein